MSKSFLDQRLSAMILLIMVPMIEFYFYQQTEHFFLMTISIFLFIALYHAYLGINDIMTDYCPNSPYIKRFLFFLFSSLAIFMSFCIIKIFCGSATLCS